MTRHTKIVATLGPASSTPEVLDRMVQAGIDVVRMNFSHGTADDHRARAEGIRAAAAKFGRTVGILGDLALEESSAWLAPVAAALLLLAAFHKKDLDRGVDGDAGRP